jgi:hypothetical protein
MGTRVSRLAKPVMARFSSCAGQGQRRRCPGAGARKTGKVRKVSRNRGFLSGFCLETRIFVLSSFRTSNGGLPMKARLTLAALILAATPGLAFAMCSGMKPSETAMSCANGMVWDSQTRTCVAPVSS